MDLNTQQLQTMDKDVLWHPFTQHQAWDCEAPLVISHAEGCWLFDTDGKRYLDGISSLWTNVHGHRHPRIDEAVRAQLDRCAHSTMLGLTHEPAIELAQLLIEKAPAGLERVFYSDSGSSAVEIALKMAFQCHAQTGQAQRTRFASLKDAYHGDTLGAVSVGSIDLFHKVYRPLLFEPLVLPAPTRPGGLEEKEALAKGLALLEAHGHELSALVVEPLVQGAAGMKMHSPDFLRTLIDAARAKGALIVADEVAVGFGRMGTLFAMEIVDRSPDLLCLAKGLSGGYLPLAATLTTQSIYEAFLGAPEEFKQFFHGHTFTGNPLACAASIASVRLFEEEARLAHVQALDPLLQQHQDKLEARDDVRECRRRGVMLGIDMTTPSGHAHPSSRRAGHLAAMAAREHGLILRPLGDTLVINPPLTITREEIEHLFAATHLALDHVKEHL